MKVVLMHGKDTNPEGKWYPWFGKEVKRAGYEYVAPTLPEAHDPKIEAWVDALEKTHPDSQTILVGHSRGGVAILRWLENQPSEMTVRKVILVATNSGFVKDRTIPTETNHGFYSPTGYDFEKIRKHCGDFVVLHSRDDQWVPFQQGEENAAGLHARFLSFEDRGHFGRGVDEIPELVKELHIS